MDNVQKRNICKQVLSLVWSLRAKVDLKDWMFAQPSSSIPVVFSSALQNTTV
jgi:hypothetical protein